MARYARQVRRIINGKPEMKFVRGLANRRNAEFQNCVGGLL